MLKAKTLSAIHYKMKTISILTISKEILFLKEKLEQLSWLILYKNPFVGFVGNDPTSES